MVGWLWPFLLSFTLTAYLLSSPGTAEGNTRFIVLTPLELNSYREMLSTTIKKRVYIQRGDLLSSSSRLPKAVTRAKAIFVFSNTEVRDKLLEDGQSLVRCLVLRKMLADRHMDRISVQLNRGREKTLAFNLGVNATIALDELKMALLAVSCTRCFGLTTLLSNMLYTAPVHHSAQARLARPKAEYRFGVAHEAYSATLPACCANATWAEAVGAIYASFGVILLGRVKRPQQDEVRPVEGAAGVETEGEGSPRMPHHSHPHHHSHHLSMDPSSMERVGTDCVVVALACSKEHLDMVKSMKS